MNLPTFLVCAAALVFSVTGLQLSEDPNQLEAVVEKLVSDVESLKAQNTALQAQLDTKDHQVAFLTQFSTDHVTTASGPYKFNSTLLNDGDGYDPATGIFTAPISGVYMFSAQFFTDRAQSERPLLDIMVNGDTFVRLAFDTQPDDLTQGEVSDSTTFTVKLQAGDRVWVTSSYNKAFTWWGSYHTFFSGALFYSI